MAAGSRVGGAHACVSGRGPVVSSEGVFGLQRAFHLAGARSVVASLWDVDPGMTRVLMTEFLSNATAGGMSKRQRSATAELKILDEGEGQAARSRITGPPGW